MVIDFFLEKANLTIITAWHSSEAARSASIAEIAGNNMYVFFFFFNPLITWAGAWRGGSSPSLKSQLFPQTVGWKAADVFILQQLLK